VAVEVSQYRPFYILGEVATPGQYPYRPRMTVLTAISIAGGFTYRAVEDYAGVTRDGGGGPAPYRAPLFALAEPGDVITVFERRF
jgi:polysaccharide export outer membrane protein